MGSFFLLHGPNIVIKGVVTSSEDGCSSWSISTSSGTNIERQRILTVSSINNVDKMRFHYLAIQVISQTIHSANGQNYIKCFIEICVIKIRWRCSNRVSKRKKVDLTGTTVAEFSQQRSTTSSGKRHASARGSYLTVENPGWSKWGKIVEFN
jgi:hypothetical protein